MTRKQIVATAAFAGMVAGISIASKSAFADSHEGKKTCENGKEMGPDGKCPDGCNEKASCKGNDGCGGKKDDKEHKDEHK